ncbi:SNARE associated Golgi protein [Syntrophomonas zehnderi OL-4]|uniref:TVP38/TMEM64 family membrane protein n=1 Tax=Syntrophomonas zehnderi OL-4 TaxID=690567 RepID=A0A0E4G8W5_9FIRM|nr:TVP38/TMEM64 family protein [Syntrophomonas zehnderi]CFW99629.1 SNARE associated Golgi protein [Syntrophomonas zehnderi OL-4]
MFENLTVLNNYVQQFGHWAPLVLFILFVIQAALPVFPYIILAAAGGMLFGFKLGFFLAWFGALCGACLAFWICRLLGYNPLAKWLDNRYGYNIDNHNPTVAFWSIMISRLIPFVPTPLINVAAALGGVSFFVFVTSSAIGKLPTAILYTGLGLALFNAQDINTILLIMAATILFLLGLRFLAHRLSLKGHAEEHQEM